MLTCPASGFVVNQPIPTGRLSGLHCFLVGTGQNASSVSSATPLASVEGMTTYEVRSQHVRACLVKHRPKACIQSASNHTFVVFTHVSGAAAPQESGLIRLTLLLSKQDRPCTFAEVLGAYSLPGSGLPIHQTGVLACIACLNSIRFSGHHFNVL